jgi:hypothetical protein
MTEQHTHGYTRKSGQVLVRTLPGQTTSQWRLIAHRHFRREREIELTDYRAQHLRTQQNKKADRFWFAPYPVKPQASGGFPCTTNSTRATESNMTPWRSTPITGSE